MTTSYPSNIDSFTNPTATDTLDSATVPHAAQHDNINDAVLAVETALGANLANVVLPARSISTTAPLTGGGDLSANRTLAVSAGTTSAAGVLQLTDSTSSTSTTTAATPNSVKTAYDLANAATTYTNLSKILQASATSIDVLPRTNSLTNITNTSGTMTIDFFTASQSLTVSQISVAAGTVASASLTLARFGLYTVDASDNATLVAQTASDTTLFNSANTVYTRVFNTTGGYPSTYAVTAGSRYAIGIIQVGTTPGTVSGSGGQFPVTTLAPRINGTVAGLSDLPTSRTSYSATGQHAWSRIS